MNSAAQRTDPQDRLGALSRGLGRAFGGALLFALPMLMTMELWELGFTMDRRRLLLLLALALPMLVGVSHRLGFEKTFGWREDLRDACVALGVGMVAAAAILAMFGVIGPRMSADEIVGKIAVETVPGALGALLAQSQFGTDHPAEADERALSGYFGALFLMLVGALFFALNIAPTDEIMAIAYRMSPWHAVAPVVASLAVIHGFVFALGFRGEAARGPDAAPGRAFLLHTLPGYVIALAISFYMLWTFGRGDAIGLQHVLMATIVLAFPAAIGAAAARLII